MVGHYIQLAKHQTKPCLNVISKFQRYETKCINSVVLYLVHKLGRQHSLFITGHADTNGLDIKSVPWSRPNNRAWEDYSFQTAT